jgi:ligand-binding SRPBCC domain-containing protein
MRKPNAIAMHEIRTKQFLPISLQEAWDFFSSPANLKKITPAYMGFQVLSGFKDGDKMYPGMIINYTVRPVLGIPLAWTTEITHVQNLKYFVDEQRFGPYAFWHHKHFFEEKDGGVEMTDVVHYKLPLGILGGMAHALFVEKQLRGIFKYREEVLRKLFPLH